MGMLRTILTTAMMLALLGDVGAAAPRSAHTTSAQRPAADAMAQARPRERRRPTRIGVTPRCPYYAEASEYPRPSECDYPGPGFVRQCESRLVQEYRPSGTVIVPRMWCRWERG